MICLKGSCAQWLGTSILLLSISNALGSRSVLQSFYGTFNASSSVSVAAAQCSKIDNMDFWGADIVKLADISSFQNCCNRCWKNKSCDRWTYSSATKRCWLKRATGWTKRPTEGKISGRVFRASSSSSLVPSPIPVPSPPPIPVPSLPNLGPIPSNGEYTKSNYGDVLGLSWLFYEAQRSGNLPANNRIPWRKSSHTQDIVPGGWYDAGDYLKLNFPLASVVSFLAWGMLEFKEGYQQAGQTQHALDNLYAAADYLRRCHIAPRKYIGQIGHPDIDHAYWGRADQQKSSRPAYVYDSTMGASDLMGKVAAALASSSMVWRDINSTFSTELLTTAKSLYEWGTEKSGKYSNYYKAATASIYPSSDWADDMAWGAYWLYRATGQSKYLDDAVTYWKTQTWDVTAGWDNSGAAVAVALANLVEDGMNVPSGSQIKNWVTNEFIKNWAEAKGDISKTPKGMHYPKWSKWGNLQLSTTAAFLALTHAKHSRTQSVRQTALGFARDQVDYAMGSSGRSYVIGFGEVYPLHAHHAGASCPDRPAKCDWATFSSSKPNGQILYGALVAGPEGPGDESYRDKRDDYVSNEVAVDYNSGFTSALAGLVELT